MSIPTEYDRFRYPNRPSARTHPGRLAAIARLHGIATVSPAKCRMLEVGCGEAAELLPLALAYPQSQFLGVDLSTAAIEYGEALRQQLSLNNLNLRVRDLRAIMSREGPFDFIIARGVFSWVPEDVRFALMELCANLLTPTGVALITYNAYPGWHIVRMIREMLLAHVGDTPDAATRVKLAKDLLRFLSVGSPLRGPLGDLYQTELHAQLNFPDGFLYHDELAEINEPYYVSGFAEIAARVGLNYLADADYFGAETRGLPPSIHSVLEGLDRQDAVMGEQYRDFLNLRRYRQTLLVRAETPVIRPATSAAIPGLHVSGHANLRPEAALDLESKQGVRFIHDKGAALRVDEPIAKAGLAELSDAAGRAIAFPELLQAALNRLGRSSDSLDAEEPDWLASVLLDAFRTGLVVFEVDPLRYALQASEFPTVCPLVRAQLRAGYDAVTNLRRTYVPLADPFHRAVLNLLDGTRDRAALLPVAAEFPDENLDATARIEAVLNLAARDALLVS